MAADSPVGLHLGLRMMALGDFVFGGGNLDEKVKVARLSILSNTVLTIGKLVTGLVMGSVSVISDAIHSGTDLIASVIAYISVKISGKPADDNHRYGHGKFENIAAIIEAILILVAATAILSQAVPRLLSGGGEVKSLGLGAAVMIVSAGVNMFVSQKLMNTAKRTDSPALAADAWHLRVDVFTSVGVLVGIILIKITGLVIIDPIIAIAVTFLIIKVAYDLIRESLGSILDASLPEREEQIIHQVLERYADEYVQFHDLRTRRSGPDRHVDLHLVVPRKRPIMSAHQLCHRIENDVRESLPGLNIHVLVRAEPCRPGEEDCEICNIRVNTVPVEDKSKELCDDCSECDKSDDAAGRPE